MFLKGGGGVDFDDAAVLALAAIVSLFLFHSSLMKAVEPQTYYPLKSSHAFPPVILLLYVLLHCVRFYLPHLSRQGYRQLQRIWYDRTPFLHIEHPRKFRTTAAVK